MKPPRPSRRSVRSIAVYAVAIVSTALVVLSLVRLGSGRESSQAGSPAPPESGELVYLGENENGVQRLWILDLVTDEVQPGAPVRDATKLVRIEGTGWSGLGVIRTDRGGDLEAAVLSGPSRYANPMPLVRGDLIAWGPGGTSVVAGRRGRGPGRCRASVATVVFDLQRDTDRRTQADGLCGDLLAVGRTSSQTLASFAHGSSISTSTVPSASPPTLHDGMLSSVSPTGDLLVTPTELAGTSRHARPRPSAGTVLYRRGKRRAIPLLDGERSLIVDDVLDWAGDASRALVVGRLGGPRRAQGVYVIDTGPTGPASPIDVTKVTSLAFAVRGGSLADDGTAYVSVRGAILASRNGRTIPVELPPGAPELLGPIVWLP